MNKQLSSPITRAIKRALKPGVSTLAVSSALLATSSAWAFHGDQQTAFIFYNDLLITTPQTIPPTVIAGDKPLTTATCVDLGYAMPGQSITKKFTIASSETGAASGTSDFSYDSLSSITFTGGTEFRQIGSAVNATNLINGTMVAPLCNTAGVSTVPSTTDPLKVCSGTATSIVTTPPSGTVGSFDIGFTAPTTPQIITGRYMNVYTSTDPLVNPLSVQVTASVVSSLTPDIQVLDSSLSVPPAGTDVPNGTATAINFTPTPIDSTRPPVSKNFSVKNLGAANLLLSPVTATCVSDLGTPVAEFTLTPFIDDIGTDTSTPVSNTPVDTTVVPDYSPGCPTAVKDYSKFTVTFTPPTVTKQTKYTCKVTFTSNDGGITGTKFTFPVEATVNPPPPLKPEIDVYDGTTIIPNLDKTGVDFGTTDVNKPVQRTITVKNPSGVSLNVFDFSSNLPNGFSLLNANYASVIPPGGSTNLIFQCDATAAGSFGAAQTNCASNPLGAGCALRIPSNDDDNPQWEFNGAGVENPYTFPLKCVVGGGTSTNVALTLTQPANGVVVSDAGGISCGTGSTTCTASYAPGATVKLTATADSGATFSGWGSDCTGTTSPLTVTMDKAKNCTATFTAGGGGTGTKFQLSIDTPSKGVVASDTGGINCGTGGSTCAVDYTASTLVKLTATPDSGATFTNWGGDCSGTTNPLEVTMDAAKKCTATFGGGTITQTTLKIDPVPTQGNVMSSTGGINCGPTGTSCSATLSKGDTVQLVAAGTGVMLGSWGGGCAGNNNPLAVTMDADKTCSATFTAGGTATQTTLTITQPTGGSVASSTGGINCGTGSSVCVANYAPNATVTLTATPDSGGVFTSWGGDCTGATSPLTVTIDKAKTCTATFSSGGGVPANLTVSISGNGSVTRSPTGTSCGANCTTYPTGTAVTLNAVPSTGATFTGWGGSCSGTAASTTVTLDAAKSCTAMFSTVNNPPPPGNQALTVTVSGNGAITSDSGGINCGGGSSVCNASYTSGSIVKLTATPSGGSTFTNWSGGCSGNSATAVVTMDAAKSCTATFSGGGGSGVGDPNVVSCYNQNGIYADGKCLQADNLQPGAVNASGIPVNVTVSMKGGISKNGGPYLKESTVVLADPIATRGVIQVDPADEGKKVDVIVAGIQYSSMYPRGFEWYMLEGCNICVKVWPYSDRDAAPILAQLTALKTVDAIPSVLMVDMYAGHFVYSGLLDIFYGYRVVDSGKVVFNASPIRVTINP